MNTETIRVEAIQMNIEPGNKHKNLTEALKRIEEAKALEVDIACLPELFLTGYSLDNIQELAEEIPGPSIQQLCEIARKLDINIVAGSIPEKAGNKLFNTSVIIDGGGKIKGVYRKVHLFEPFDEPKYFSAGSSIDVFDLSTVRIGVEICYDIRFPEISRILCLKGAQIIFVPAEFPHPRVEHWELLVRTRALENQLYVVAVNRVGSDDRASYFGLSMIVNPWGRVLARAGSDEEIVTADIRLSQIEEVRSSIPCLRDRRPDVYKLSLYK